MEKHKYENTAPQSKLNQWWNTKTTPLGWIWLTLFILLIIANILGV